MIWEKKLLSDLFRVCSSKRVLQSQWKNEGIPFYRGREISRLSSDGFVNNELFISEEHYEELASKYGVPSEGDIVITAIGTIGNTHVVRATDKFYFKDASVLWLKKAVPVNSEFINLWLKSPIFFSQLDKGKGATVDTLTIQKLQSVQINLPPLPEQQRIVSILDKAFADIATVTSKAEKNLANACELFDSYLQSALTNKGEGWETKKLGDVCSLLNRGVSPKYLEQDGICVLNQKCIRDHQVNYEQSRRHDQKAKPVNQSRLIQLGDGLVNSTGTGTLGRVAQVRDEPIEPTTVDSHVTIVRPKPDKFFLDFFGYMLIFIEEKIKEAGEGCGGQTELARSVLAEKFTVSYPISLSEQQSIVNKLDELLVETKRLESIYQQKLNALTELKKSILNQAFSLQLQ